MVHKNEFRFALVSGVIALTAIFALPSLVAKPKLLFGRSLSAMEPTLFPIIVLGLIVALSFLLAVMAWRRFRLSPPSAVMNGNNQPLYEQPWFKTTVFFLLLVSYGLLLKPVGFLLTSFLVISLTSLLLGNRNWLQIILFSLLSPVCLYLLATRAMLVSLPELNQIELFYASVFNRVGI